MAFSSHPVGGGSKTCDYHKAEVIMRSKNGMINW